MTSLRRVLTVCVTACVTGCLAALAVLATAAPFTSSFDALTADLQARRAAYSGALTSAQRREVKALDKSLARLAGTHADLGADVKSAVAVVKALKAGFPREFSGAAGGTGLANQVAGTITSLVAAAEAEVGRLDDALAVVTDPVERAAATAKLNAARSALTTAAAAATPPARAAQLLAKALDAARRGFAIAAPYVSGLFTARVGSRTFVATDVQATYDPAGGYVFITAEFVNPQTQAKESIAFFVRSPAVGTHEIGSFSPFGGNYGFYYLGELADDQVWLSQFGNGSVVLTEYDTASGRVAGTFSFDTMRNGNSTIRLRSGRFVVTNLVPQ